MFTPSEKLLNAFSDIPYSLKNGYISAAIDNKKISSIVHSAGFCPIVCSHKIEGKHAFTIVPYKRPDIFTFFSKSELADLLANRIFKGGQEKVTDRWQSVNIARRVVSSVVNSGLTELISKYHQNGQPIIELGSGSGYALSDKLNEDLILTQPDTRDCSQLQKSTTKPIYQLNLEDLHGLLSEDRRIPTFFALDVFDTMTPAQRMTSVSQISSLQGPGDHFFIILDTNPYLNEIIRHLEELHPNHGALPYMTATWTECAKLSVMMVPVEFLPGQSKPTPEDFVSVMNGEASCLQNRIPSPVKKMLEPLREKLDITVVEAETFFAEQISAQLKEVGYSTETKYHASFAVGPLSEYIEDFPEDLIYHYVTDTFFFRQWSVTDPNLHKALAQKSLALPAHINEAFAKTVKESGQKIYGAEFLVITATKN